MEFFNDLVRYSYLNHAFWACILSGITCGIIGTYVVCRRLVFLSGGITHSSFGGLGIAFYLGINPILGAMVFAVLSALGIEWANDRGRIREDSAIGIIWSVGMAIGVLFMSLRPGYTSGDLSNFLFGSIVTVTRTAMSQALAVLTRVPSLPARSAVAAPGDVRRLRPRLRPQPAASRPALISYTMSALIAVTIVLSIRIMGIVLLISLLTIPVTIVNTFTKSFRTLAPAAAAVAVAGNLAGLALSYNFEVSPGAAIIFTLTVTLILVKLLPLLVRKTPAPPHENHPQTRTESPTWGRWCSRSSS